MIVFRNEYKGEHKVEKGLSEGINRVGWSSIEGRLIIISGGKVEKVVLR